MKLCAFFIFLSISYTHADIMYSKADICSSPRPPDPQSGCCGIDATSSNFIAGGETSLLKQYPWLALLEYYVHNSVQMLCGGSLISSRYVLTAAHCMEKQAPQRVRLGEYDTSNHINQPDCVLKNRRRECTMGAISVPIQSIIVHGGFIRSNHKRNDIALVRLAWMVQFTDYIRPICLPTSDLTQNYTRNNNLYAAGWGVVYQQLISSGYKNHFDPLKQHAKLPYVRDKNCRRFWNVFDTQICAGVQGSSTCDGDSGGPLMSINYGGVYEAVGIISFGPEPCNEMGIPTVFTKVFSYKSWIDRHIIE